MSEQSVGDQAQTRIIVEQVVDAAIVRFKAKDPDATAIPTLVKWAAGIITAVLTALVTAACIWMAVTLSDLKTKVDTISDRLGDNGVVAQRFQNLEQRVDQLEEDRKHSGGAK